MQVKKISFTVQLITVFSQIIDRAILEGGGGSIGGGGWVIISNITRYGNPTSRFTIAFGS